MTQRQRGRAIILVTLVGIGTAWFVSGLEAIKPRHSDTSSYDVYVPKACLPIVMEHVKHTGVSIISVEDFLIIKDKLTACGGRVEKVK
jgi:hypothetical protein